MFFLGHPVDPKTLLIKVKAHIWHCKYLAPEKSQNLCVSVSVGAEGMKDDVELTQRAAAT